MYGLGYGLQEREKTFKDATTHISNIGEMVEDMEGRMRDALYEVVRLLFMDTLWKIYGNIDRYPFTPSG